MATILRQEYQRALEQFGIADSAKEDGLENISHVMRGDQINLLTRKIALGDNADPWAKKILALLIEQAKKLPSARIGREEMSVSDYSAGVHSLLQDAKEGTVKQISEGLKSLKEAKIYPRNEREIFTLIESQKQVRTLSSIFNFCCEVEALYNPTPTLHGDEIILAKPTSNQIARLRMRLNEMDTGKKYRALERAKLQIAEMEASLKGPLDALREIPAAQVVAPREEIHQNGRTWTWIAATAVGAVALAVLYQIFYGRP